MATSAEKLRQYEDLFEKSQAYNPAQFQSDFERSYGETTGYNKDLIQQQSQALGNLQSVAPELRQRYSQTLIKDPTLQRSLIAQARQAPIADYSTAVNLLGQRGQRYADILGKSLSGYQTSAQQAQTAAENAWRLYQDQLAQEEAAKARALTLKQQEEQRTLADVIREAQEQQRIADIRGQNEQWNAGANQAWNNQGTQTGDSSYWDTLTRAASWEPENKTLANAYNSFTDNVGGFFYNNPSPYHAIANLFKRKK